MFLDVPLKVVMINDCASVGETLLKYMPAYIEKQHIIRTRALWDKTLSLAYKILRAKGNIYHSNYLLQDCYIATRLGKKPLVGYALGTDLRRSLKHPIWGRMVRHNLKKCDKIFVSTPDILGIAKQFRDDAEYLPPPVNPELFYVKPQTREDRRKKVLIASNSNWNTKGTDMAVRALSKLKDKVDVSIIKYGSDFEKTVSLASSLGLHLSILPLIPHQRITQYYWDSDVVIDQFKVGCAGMISLEAIACGRPAITYINSEFPEYDEFPLKDVNTEEQITIAIEEADNSLWKKEHDYIEKNHRLDVIIDILVGTYLSLVEK